MAANLSGVPAAEPVWVVSAVLRVADQIGPVPGPIGTSAYAVPPPG
ncbi:hypothetical protein [Kribbella sp. NBC_00359]